MVCERGWGRPYLYYLESVPAISIHGNIDNRRWEDKCESPAKGHLDGIQSGFEQSTGSANPLLPSFTTAFDWVTDRWVLVLNICVPGLCTSVWPVKWAHLVSVTQDRIFYVLLLRSLVFYVVFHLWVSANQNSWNWLAISPATKYGNRYVMKCCRSWRLILGVKNRQQHPHT